MSCLTESVGKMFRIELSLPKEIRGSKYAADENIATINNFNSNIFLSKFSRKYSTTALRLSLVL